MLFATLGDTCGGPGPASGVPGLLCGFMDRALPAAPFGLGESSGVFNRFEGLGPGTEPGPLALGATPLAEEPESRWLKARPWAAAAAAWSAGELRPEAARGDGRDRPVVELGEPGGPVPGDVIVPGTLDDRCVWW